MELKRRALYNLLRMNWLHDSSIEVQSWQVENYREWNSGDLLEVLCELDGEVTRSQFLSYAGDCDGPEVLASQFVQEGADPELEDQVYLIVFELWRRWVPENPSLSIFCDELDHRIVAYDAAELEDDEEIQDSVASLLDILDEGVDQGAEPHEVFGQVASYCANDLESFLYDYMDQQIQDENLQYASELLEGFAPYTDGDPWYRFLDARLQAATDIDQANDMFCALINEQHDDRDLNLEMLHFLSQTGDRKLFIALAKQTLPLLESEDELLELMDSVGQYYRCLDYDGQESKIDHLIEERSEFSPDHELKGADPVFEEIITILDAPAP